MLRNLVANALKYTRAGWVKLRCRHDAKTSVRIEVLDTVVDVLGAMLDVLLITGDTSSLIRAPAQRG